MQYPLWVKSGDADKPGSQFVCLLNIHREKLETMFGVMGCKDFGNYAFWPPCGSTQDLRRYRREDEGNASKGTRPWRSMLLAATKIMNRLWLILILFLGLLTSAIAQVSAVEREIKGKSGQDIRIGIFANVRPDCTSGPLPTIRLVAPPEHGRITVRNGKLKATNIKQCLALEAPTLVVVYQSAADFEGSDSAIIEIRSAQGALQLQRFTFSLSKAGPKPKDIKNTPI